jgi:hypothetical protein
MSDTQGYKKEHSVTVNLTLSMLSATRIALYSHQRTLQSWIELEPDERLKVIFKEELTACEAAIAVLRTA